MISHKFLVTYYMDHKEPVNIGNSYITAALRLTKTLSKYCRNQHGFHEDEFMYEIANVLLHAECIQLLNNISITSMRDEMISALIRGIMGNGGEEASSTEMKCLIDELINCTDANMIMICLIEELSELTDIILQSSSIDNLDDTQIQLLEGNLIMELSHVILMCNVALTALKINKDTIFSLQQRILCHNCEELCPNIKDTYNWVILEE